VIEWQQVAVCAVVRPLSRTLRSLHRNGRRYRPYMRSARIGATRSASDVFRDAAQYMRGVDLHRVLRQRARRGKFFAVT